MRETQLKTDCLGQILLKVRNVFFAFVGLLIRQGYRTIGVSSCRRISLTKRDFALMGSLVERLSLRLFFFFILGVLEALQIKVFCSLFFIIKRVIVFGWILNFSFEVDHLEARPLIRLTCFRERVMISEARFLNDSQGKLSCFRFS